MSKNLSILKSYESTNSLTSSCSSSSCSDWSYTSSLLCRDGLYFDDIDLYLRASKTAYYLQKKPNTINVAKLPGVNKIFYECDRFFIAAASESNMIIVAFRGSSPCRKDIVRVVSWVPEFEEEIGLYVPHGIRKEGNLQFDKQNLAQELQKAIDATPGCEKVVFTGHSLGGSLASFTALKIRKTNPTMPPIDVYTFGALPCVNDPNIDDIGGFDVYNFVNNRDLAPRGSWQRMSGGYCGSQDVARNAQGFRRHMHVMGNKLILMGGTTKLGGFFDCVMSGGIQDHSLENYNTAIQEWFANDPLEGEDLVARILIEQF